MNHIKTFDYRNYKTVIDIKRLALRAVVQRDDLILLIYLNKTNEYKFPGGGLEAGESKLEALYREVLEEAGALVTNVIKEIGYIDQIYPDKYKQNEIFSMRSIYFQCDVKESVQPLNLSNHESKLGFKPVWVTLEEAIKINELRVLNKSEHHWTERELFMLKYIKNRR